MAKRYARQWSRITGERIKALHIDTSGVEADWAHDIFFEYPNRYVRNTTDNYHDISSFYRLNKAKQRIYLDGCGLKVPFTRYSHGHCDGEELPGDWEYVVRPLRHTQGRGYRTTFDCTDYDPQSEYISRMFPKRWEYRVFIVKGKPLFTLLKREPDNPPELSIRQSQPWNRRAGYKFITVRNPDNNRLRWTTIYNDIQNVDIFKHVHCVALDVMLGDKRLLGMDHHPYAISEVNFAPLITVTENFQTIVHALENTDGL